MLCATMSKPSSSGRWKNGVAKVLSQTETTLFLRQISATAARSTIFSIGFVGVSVHKRRVLGVIARSTLRGSVMSTKARSMPSLLNTLSAMRKVPP